MRQLYPAIEPYAVSTLKVSELHTLRYEEVGNPSGRPALFLHGGPGVGIHPAYRQFFDPEKYRVVLLDQRGAGGSTPHAEIQSNTTFNLVEDIERLRIHLGINDWVVMGGSWGCLLALCYAIQYPQSVAALILRGIFLGRQQEQDWLLTVNGAAKLYPDEWQHFRAPFGTDENLAKHYVDTFNSNDSEAVKRAVAAWSRWTACMNTLLPDQAVQAQMTATQASIAMARLESHYSANGFFLPSDNYVLDSCNAIEHIPCHLVQGRYDIICPAVSAWELNQALPVSKLTIVPDGAHAPTDPGMVDAIIRASDQCHTY